jgi:hypothetical protein
MVRGCLTLSRIWSDSRSTPNLASKKKTKQAAKPIKRSPPAVASKLPVKRGPHAQAEEDYFGLEEKEEQIAEERFAEESSAAPEIPASPAPSEKPYQPPGMLPVSSKPLHEMQLSADPVEQKELVGKLLEGRYHTLMVQVIGQRAWLCRLLMDASSLPPQSINLLRHLREQAHITEYSLHAQAVSLFPQFKAPSCFLPKGTKFADLEQSKK